MSKEEIEENGDAFHASTEEIARMYPSHEIASTTKERTGNIIESLLNRLKNKNLEEMLEAILNDPQLQTKEAWEFFIEIGFDQYKESRMTVINKLYANLDAILAMPLPDKMVNTLFSNATNIYLHSRQMKQKIYDAYPEVITNYWKNSPNLNRVH